MQIDEAKAPATSEYLPAEQNEHAEEPVAAPKYPAGQLVQVNEATDPEYWPAEQPTHAEAPVFA